ncbi:MAG: MFS transporter [Thermoplasmata archaeon]
MMDNALELQKHAKYDINILMLTRVLRNFYFGYLSFLLPLFLRFHGFSYMDVGLYALLTTISSSVLVLISGFFGDLYSRKKMLVIMSSLSIFFLVIVISTTNYTLLMVSSVFGITLSGIGGGAGGGPIAPLINAMVADRVKVRRTMVYSSLTSLGIFSAVFGSMLSAVISAKYADYFTILFTVALVLSVISVILTMTISEWKVERAPEKKKVLPTRSGKSIIYISFAGALGSLGLGIILPLLSIWFHDVGLSMPIISVIFALSYIVSAITVNFSSFFERLIGSINSIVLFRALGSVLLIFIPFVPILFSVILFIARTAFYQMALPVRQNFSMNLFTPEERSRGSSITGIFRRLPYGFATELGSVMFTLSIASLAFVSAGMISVLDPVFYYMFFKDLTTADH